ncbi:MAG: transcriptional regulator [Thaumarchaeota archaeon]|jgi:probable regulatory domain-containing protein|nr:transcriptional regulator [Candidatus Geocrenenecus arthurdayi]
MSEEIPLSPIGREEIHKLEYALLVGTLFRAEVLEELRNPSERLTWVDSLAVAAAAIAREKAKMTISQIAEDIGRTESTIRNHLTGKTKAGQLVRQTLEKFLREGVKIDLPSTKELEELKVRLEEERKKSQKLEILLQEVKNSLKDLVEKLEKI